MSFVLAAAGLASGGGIYKTIAGARQAKRGKDILKNLVRPTYTRPGEVTQALNLAERNYLNGMPGANIAENRIGTSSATAMGTATQGASSSADVLDAATRINLNENNALNDLAVQEANFKQNALGGYLGELHNNATYADKEFDYNLNQPYQQKAAEASALIGAGNQNIYSGVSDIAGLGTNLLMGGFGGGASGGTATMGQKMGNPTVAAASMAGVTPSTMSVNPGTMGKMIYDPETGTMRRIV